MPVERCPWAVWVDERGGEHPPVAPDGGRDRASEAARRAVGNLAILRGRYAQATAVIGGLALAGLAGLAVAAAATVGLLPLGADAGKGLAIPSALGAAFFGYFAWKQFRHWRSWGGLCHQFAGPAAMVGAGAGGASRPQG